MKRVTLTAVTAPSNLEAIKTLRAITGMGLKDSKDMHDDVRDGKPRELLIPNDALPSLGTAFDFTVEPEAVIDRDTVLEFVMDALAFSDPSTANTLMGLPSWQALREALR